MSLGAIEYSDPKNFGLKTTSLVLAFRPVAVRVVDKPATGIFSIEEAHYEASPTTEITVAGKIHIGQYGGDLARSFTVPFTYDEVKALLAEGLKKGEPVDFTDGNTANLRSRLTKPAGGGGSQKLNL